MTYQERKAARVAHFKRFVEGWVSVRCSACSGHGRYDSHDSPACSACGGTGKVKAPPPSQKPEKLL